MRASIIGGIVALAVSVTSLAAQSPTPSQITGRVTDDSGTPISGVRVMLAPAERPVPGAIPRMLSAVTDTEGKFTIDFVPPGSHRVMAQKQGFAFEPGSLEPVEVGAGQAAAVEVILRRGGTITGRILDERGEPLTDVRVIAMRRLSDRGDRPIGFGGPGMMTNDLGEFRIAGLLEGEYVIMAAPQSSPFGAHPAGSTTWAPTYYPGTTESSQAQTVTVRATDTVAGIEFRLISAPSFRVSGVVVDAGGQPVTDAMVTLRPLPAGQSRGFFPASFNQANPDGTFVVSGVIPGAYSVAAVRMVRSGASSSTVVSMLNLNAGVPEQQITVDASDVTGLKVVVQGHQ